MTVKITQQIEQTAPAEYAVTLTMNGEHYSTDVFQRGNAVFPAYRTLMNAMYDIEDCALHVLTDSAPLVREFNGTPNPNATMLRNLNDVIAQQGLTVSIEYKNGN
ncbi:hypothetical protein [Sporosarcina obsidiansis]|uniref:hypothetical protein n=1 Tax=Sporosarcina obsidiansis TaxID=2660748 RepID=UPI00129B09F9|nr:hypothetical protein [Sporosarcina obsidiansis]